MAQEQYIHTRCPRCGKKLKYDRGKRGLKCSNCRYSRALGRNTDQVDTHPLTSGVSFDAFQRGLGLTLYDYQCQKCKTVIASTQEEPLEECPFCGTKDKWEKVEMSKDQILPYQMIPFTLSESSARSILSKWLKNKWLYPGSINKCLEEGHLKGVYMPVFFADVFTRSTWKGEASFQYAEQRGDRVVKRSIREPVKGYYENFYENFARNQTSGAKKSINDIMPFQISQGIPYDAEFLKNWYVELYQSDLLGELREMEKQIDKLIEGQAKRRSKGNDLKRLMVRSEKMLIAFRTMLIPVWVGGFTYQGKRFQYLVNGQTGEVTGKIPLSFRRIAMLVVGGVGLVGGLILLATL
ncbi:MAG: hypothetical protein AAFW00_03015 [Bacteroidota bacterium]